MKLTKRQAVILPLLLAMLALSFTSLAWKPQTHHLVIILTVIGLIAFVLESLRARKTENYKYFSQHTSMLIMSASFALPVLTGWYQAIYKQDARLVVNASILSLFCILGFASAAWSFYDHKRREQIETV